MSGTDDKTQAGGSAFVPSRRTVLVLGAAAASTVVTVRPALAQTAGSVLNCEIPVPGPHAGGNYIARRRQPGRARHARRGAAAGAAADAARRCKVLLRSGTTPAGVDPTSAQAYANYIRRLQSGMSGFTCYASLQMPR